MAQKKVLPTEFVHVKSSEFLYQPLYCEENIWHLACRQELKTLASWVLMVSNEKRTVAMAHMRRSNKESPLLVWDYHVIWLGLIHNQLLVMDLDTRLPLPMQLEDYLQFSFPSRLPEEYQPHFRLIDARTYCEQFSSDRSHMLDEANQYMAKPPPWPAIQNGETSVLMPWLDFSNEAAPGEILGLAELLSWAETFKAG